MNHNTEDNRKDETTADQNAVASSKDWLMKAIEQKHPRLTVGVACSELLVYDRIDRLVLLTAMRN